MADAQDRGWGPPGSGRIVRVTAPNGVPFPGGVRSEIAHLVEGMVREFHERGYHAKDGWCWGYAYRKIRGSTTKWSNHAWGLAIDFNAPDHPLGKRGTGVPLAAVEIAARWGFFWGGNYSGRADEMHYEFLGTPADVARYPLGGVQIASTEEDDMDLETLQKELSYVHSKLDAQAEEIGQLETRQRQLKDRGDAILAILRKAFPE